MNYEESHNLMNDNAFRGRIKVACLHYASYILDEAANIPAHHTRLKWAQRTIASPDVSAAEATPAVVMDGQVQADGAAITDELLQGSVETTINKML